MLRVFQLSPHEVFLSDCWWLLFVNSYVGKFVLLYKKGVSIMHAKVKQPGHQDTGLIHVQWINNGLCLKHK